MEFYFFTDVSLENVDALSPVMVPLGAPSGMQSEEKKEALGELLKMAREETPDLWQENFNILLSLIMKNIGDDEVIRKCMFIFIDLSALQSFRNFQSHVQKRDSYYYYYRVFLAYLLVDDSFYSFSLSVWCGIDNVRRDLILITVTSSKRKSSVDEFLWTRVDSKSRADLSFFVYV